MNNKHKYNPQKHHRRSIRLRGYDYSQPGLYFVTICCQNRHHLFGKIENGKMILNDAGKIANDCWLDIPNHFSNVVLHHYIIMPNHVHGIIELVETNTSGVGAKNISPINTSNDVHNIGTKNISPINTSNDVHNIGTKNISPINTSKGVHNIGTKNISPLQLPPRGTSKTVGSIVRGFKIGVTKWMRKNTNIYNVWQRNYYEHIIRNDISYQNISNYIINNPINWEKDKFFTE